MARRKKRTNRKTHSPTTPIVTYTVTVAHEPGAVCDACAQPRAVLIEQESGAWICELCAGLFNDSDFFNAALINGIYNAAGDGL